MFDIGFIELVLVAIVALLVIGPERLPGAIRTTTGWVRHIRRSISEIKTEIEQDLHNDQVLSELRQAKNDIQQDVETLTTSVQEGQRGLHDAVNPPLDDSESNKKT